LSKIWRFHVHLRRPEGRVRACPLSSSEQPRAFNQVALAVVRRCFFDRSRAELDRRGRCYTLVSGEGEQRWMNALEAIREAS